jgi:hypothetical protein
VAVAVSDDTVAPKHLPSLPPHPRIRLSSEGLTALTHTIKTDEGARTIYQNLLVYADTWLDVDPVDCIPTGSNGALLSESRAVLDLVYSVGLAYRISGQTKYFDRVRAELLRVSDETVCTSGWNPPNFLAVAEVSDSTHALWISVAGYLSLRVWVGVPHLTLTLSRARCR